MPSALDTPRLRLRRHDGRDADWNLRLIAERPLDPQPRSVEEERDRLDAQAASAVEVGFGLYAVELADERTPIGYCGLIVGRATASQPEVAYELLRAHVGNGYATEAAAAMVDAAFEAGFPALWATVETWNAPSFRVLEKLGFRARRRVIGENGKVLVWMRCAAPARRHRAGTGG